MVTNQRTRSQRNQDEKGECKYYFLKVRTDAYFEVKKMYIQSVLRSEVDLGNFSKVREDKEKISE